MKRLQDTFTTTLAQEHAAFTRRQKIKKDRVNLDFKREFYNSVIDALEDNRLLATFYRDTMKITIVQGSDPRIGFNNQIMLNSEEIKIIVEYNNKKMKRKGKIFYGLNYKNCISCSRKFYKEYEGSITPRNHMNIKKYIIDITGDVWRIIFDLWLSIQSPAEIILKFSKSCNDAMVLSSLMNLCDETILDLYHNTTACVAIEDDIVLYKMIEDVFNFCDSK